MWNQQLVDDGYFQGCTVYNINYSQLVNISYAERPPITVTDTIPCPYGIHYSTVGGQSLAEKVLKIFFLHFSNILLFFHYGAYIY